MNDTSSLIAILILMGITFLLCSFYCVFNFIKKQWEQITKAPRKGKKNGKKR